jgi:MoxR-vWA-beta-propeller ternary system domain bpX2
VNRADKTALLKDVRCASLPVEALGALADLRGQAEIRVTLAGGLAWIHWPLDAGPQLELLARRILSVEGVEIFTERAGEWYRLGEHLPAFGVPFRGGTTGVPLEQIVIPSKISVSRPGEGANESLRVRLVRDLQERVRPATAFRCPLSVLASWADTATSAQLNVLQGAWRAASGGEPGEAVVLVVGHPGALPLVPESVRYWGDGLLIPLGFRAEPDLPESAIRGVAGAGEGDLAILDLDGLELIAHDLFKPLSRSAIRLARAGSIGAGSAGGGSRA